jgi:hypothetical protein
LVLLYLVRNNTFCNKKLNTLFLKRWSNYTQWICNLFYILDQSYAINLYKFLKFFLQINQFKLFVGSNALHPYNPSLHRGDSTERPPGDSVCLSDLRPGGKDEEQEQGKGQTGVGRIPGDKYATQGNT